jgi:MerR family copper efflux transcriptional regulator
MPASTLTIGQAAAAAGLTRKAVRVYEAKGLLSVADRTPAGYRLYDHHDVELLTFIRRARKLGLHLDDIRKILAIRSGGAPPCATVRDMLDERISDIDATVTELLSLRRSLIDTRRRADDCCAEGTPTICRAIEDPESAI